MGASAEHCSIVADVRDVRIRSAEMESVVTFMMPETYSVSKAM